MLSHYSLISFGLCQTYAVIILELHLFEIGKVSFSGYCTAGSCFVCIGIHCLCRCMYLLLLMLLY